MPVNASAFACNTYSYTITQTVTDCLTHLAELGFREVELMMYPGHLWPPEIGARARRALRRHTESLGTRVATLNMPNVDMNVAGATPEMRRYTLGLLQGIVDLAGDLGVPGIVIGPGKPIRCFPLRANGSSATSSPRSTPSCRTRKRRVRRCGSKTCRSPSCPGSTS